MRPQYLKPNDKIALVAPARKIAREEIVYAIQILNDWGLEVVFDERLFKVHHQFGGNDEERLDLFQSMLDDASIKALLCVRGGYGTTRIIDRLDFYKFKELPKWVCGYSDATALLCHIFNFGIESIHSTMPMLFQRDAAESLEGLRRLLFGENYEISASPHQFNRHGVAVGKIIGGNLSIINTLLSTSSDINTDGVILFIEDIDEYLYNIDRMMVHLQRAGKLEKLSGLIVGHMTDMKDNAIPFGHSANEIILSITGKYNFPICFGFPVGHEPINMAIPCGRNARLVIDNNGSKLTFASKV